MCITGCKREPRAGFSDFSAGDVSSEILWTNCLSHFLQKDSVLIMHRFNGADSLSAMVEHLKREKMGAWKCATIVDDEFYSKHGVFVDSMTPIMDDEDVNSSIPMRWLLKFRMLTRGDLVFNYKRYHCGNVFIVPDPYRKVLKKVTDVFKDDAITNGGLVLFLPSRPKRIYNETSTCAAFYRQEILPARLLKIERREKFTELKYSEYWLPRKKLVSVFDVHLMGNAKKKADLIIAKWKRPIFRRRIIDVDCVYYKGCTSDSFTWIGIPRQKCLSSMIPYQDQLLMGYYFISLQNTDGKYLLGIGENRSDFGIEVFFNSGDMTSGLQTALPGIRDILGPIVEKLDGNRNSEMAHFWKSEDFWKYSDAYEDGPHFNCYDDSIRSDFH